MSRSSVREKRAVPPALVVCIAFVTGVAEAADFEISIETNDVAVDAVHQPLPAFPDGDFRRGQEGWVRINFVIDADGRAVDPIIVDSSGGVLFEEAALQAIPEWRFAAPESGSEIANNDIEIRFELQGDRDRATRNFLRRYRNIALDLYNTNVDKARKEVDTANEFGGWNLYELTMLSLLNGRVEGAEGNAVGQLEYYRRGLSISNTTALDGAVRRDVMTRIFEIEFDTGQYGSAAATLERLRGEAGGDEGLTGITDKVRALEQSLATGEPVRASARLYSPCDCDEGDALWSYVPAKRHFSFDSIDGEVERFEARCDSGRVTGVAMPGSRWSLPEEFGSCRIFVFGDDAASFEFVEYESPGGEEMSPDAVAGGAY